MPTIRESICCKEVPKVLLKMEKSKTPIDCIIARVGFEPVCLDEEVLGVAYHTYRQQHGERPEQGNE